jgi:hypothetical protein
LTQIAEREGIVSRTLTIEKKIVDASSLTIPDKVVLFDGEACVQLAIDFLQMIRGGQTISEKTVEVQSETKPLQLKTEP